MVISVPGNHRGSIDECVFIANEPAKSGSARRRSAGEAAENSAARRMAYAKKFSIGIEKCKCKV